MNFEKPYKSSMLYISSKEREDLLNQGIEYLRANPEKDHWLCVAGEACLIVRRISHRDSEEQFDVYDATLVRKGTSS